MIFEEGFEISSVRSPMIDHDPDGMNFKKALGAASDDQPDDSVPIVRRQLRQTFSGTSQDRLMSVFEAPLNGVEDGPVVQRAGVDEVKVGRGRDEDSFGKEQRPGGGLK